MKEEYPKWIYQNGEGKIIQSEFEFESGWFECPSESLENKTLSNEFFNEISIQNTVPKAKQKRVKKDKENDDC